MINSRKILEGQSDQLTLTATPETIVEKGFSINPKATRIVISFDLDQSVPENIAVIGRLTKDGNIPDDTYGTQFQYGQIIDLSLDQARNWVFVKLLAGPTVNFMVDQFVVEQHRR